MLEGIFSETQIFCNTTRITLQNVLLTKSGTLLGNISLMRDMKNAIDLCMQSGLEVNKVVRQIQQKT